MYFLLKLWCNRCHLFRILPQFSLFIRVHWKYAVFHLDKTLDVHSIERFYNDKENPWILIEIKFSISINLRMDAHDLFLLNGHIVFPIPTYLSEDSVQQIRETNKMMANSYSPNSNVTRLLIGWFSCQYNLYTGCNSSHLM